MPRFAYISITVAAACGALLGTTGTLSAAEWEVKTTSDGKKNVCVVLSAKRPVSDGYQQVTAQLVVDDRTVAIQSDSALDMGSSDIGLKVGSRELVTADRLSKERVAVFSSHYAEIVQLFKSGKDAHAQLRFWPTWPTTGTHVVTFSLLGFTKAYEDAMKCAQ